MQIGICGKTESSLSFSYEKLLPKKQTWGRSTQCVAINVFFH